MPNKADLPAILCVLDVPLRRLSDDERLPLALVKLVGQFVTGQGNAISSPAEYADGAQQPAVEAFTSRLVEITIALQRAPRSSAI